MDYTKASKWPVLDESGTHVGDIIRQRGTTLWSLQRRGMDRPFKRNIHTLDAAKKLAAEYPQVWAGKNFNLRQSALHLAVWIAILAGMLGVLNAAIG
jgi:hypothetical protein